MTTRLSSAPRCIALSAFAAMLTACGGGPVPVRDGPQAIHPSPSPLAQGVVVAAETTAVYSCGGPNQLLCRAISSGDGSQPIID